MKMVFNLYRAASSRARRSGLALALGLGAGAVLGTATAVRPAAAQTTYFTPRAVLAEFFPASQTVTYKKFDLTPEQRTRIEQRLGYALKKAAYTIYIAKTGERVDGYALLDEEMGQHLPISYAVKFSPRGAVERHEVMVYRERYGDEVRDPRFSQQFTGKTAADSLRPGEDVIAVSGATISSRAMALGVRRGLVLLDELVLQPGRAPAGTDKAPAKSS